MRDRPVSLGGEPGYLVLTRMTLPGRLDERRRGHGACLSTTLKELGPGPNVGPKRILQGTARTTRFEGLSEELDALREMQPIARLERPRCARWRRGEHAGERWRDEWQRPREQRHKKRGRESVERKRRRRFSDSERSLLGEQPGPKGRTVKRQLEKRLEKETPSDVRIDGQREERGSPPVLVKGLPEGDPNVAGPTWIHRREKSPTQNQTVGLAEAKAKGVGPAKPPNPTVVNPHLAPLLPFKTISIPATAVAHLKQHHGPTAPPAPPTHTCMASRLLAQTTRPLG